MVAMQYLKELVLPVTPSGFSSVGPPAFSASGIHVSEGFASLQTFASERLLRLPEYFLRMHRLNLPMQLDSGDARDS